MARGMLGASVPAGESVLVIMPAGEADLTCAGRLGALITRKLAGGTRQLTIDVPELRFAGSASIRTLVRAARTLKERDASLVLLRPRRPVARMLALIGADQVSTTCGISTATP